VRVFDLNPRIARHAVFGVAAAILLTSCTEGEMNERYDASSGSAPAVVDVRSAIASLASARIYFGHQSVGANIIEGLRALEAETATGPKLTIEHTRDLDAAPATGLIEFYIGENGHPDSKVRDFASVIDQAKVRVPAIAMFKYCFLDITPQTDVAKLFTAHRDSVRAMQRRHPELVFVHVTSPLTTVETGPKLLVKRLLQKPTARETDRKRNEFNALLRREFAGEPIFDLARVESTHPAGSRSYFRDGADTVYTLAAELTDDGGHLNAIGERLAATELLSVLARAATTTRTVARTEGVTR
jgi:hypothetical protein